MATHTRQNPSAQQLVEKSHGVRFFLFYSVSFLLRYFVCVCFCRLSILFSLVVYCYFVVVVVVISTGRRVVIRGVTAGVLT